jgi:hypothetical protein
MYSIVYDVDGYIAFLVLADVMSGSNFKCLGSLSLSLPEQPLASFTKHFASRAMNKKFKKASSFSID